MRSDRYVLLTVTLCWTAQLHAGVIPRPFKVFDSIGQHVGLLSGPASAVRHLGKNVFVEMGLASDGPASIADPTFWHESPDCSGERLLRANSTIANVNPLLIVSPFTGTSLAGRAFVATEPTRELSGTGSSERDVGGPAGCIHPGQTLLPNGFCCQAVTFGSETAGNAKEITLPSFVPPFRVR